MKKESLIKKVLKITAATFAITILLLAPSVPVKADLSTDDTQSILNNWPSWVAGDDLACGEGQNGASAGSNGAPGTNQGSWNSGLQPPYILEQFMIETLKDIAHKLGKSETDAVTEEHVVAMVAFAIGEGGDINNTSGIFNPFNTGISAPDLTVGGAHNTSGLQSFKSFDAGVEATARVMTNKTPQGRLGDILTQPKSSAADFINVLAHPNTQQGQAYWAEASDPSSRYYEPNYIGVRMQLINQVRSHYADNAGLVIGTPAKEFQLHQTIPSKLYFHPAGSSPASGNSGTVSTSTSCDTSTVSGAGAAAIVEMAGKLAWHDGRESMTPRPEYTAALNAHNRSGLQSYNGADCGAFVGTVIRSTVDPNYPGLGTDAQKSYLQKSPLWDYKQLGPNDTPKTLEPGDILIVSLGGGGLGHVYLYMGPLPGGFDAAMASFGDYMPTYSHAWLHDDRGYYARARLKAGGAAAAGVSVAPTTNKNL